MSTAARPAAPAAAPRGLTRQDAGMLAVCLIWGANFTAMKIGMAEMPPLAFTAVRFAVGSVLLWAVLRVVEGKQGPLPAGSFRKLVWLGVVGNTLYQLAFTLGLDMSTASNTALIISTVPVVVAVMGGVLGIERTTSRMRWGLALATLGVALVVAARGIAFSTQTLAGDLLAVGAVFCWSAYTLGLRTLHDGLSPLRVTAWTMYTGTPGLVLAGLPQLAGVDWAELAPRFWGALAYAACLSLVVAYLLWNSSVKTVGGNRTAIYMCITPVIAVLVAWAMLGEVPHALQAVGAALIIGGVLLSRRGPGIEPKVVPAAEG